MSSGTGARAFASTCGVFVAGTRQPCPRGRVYSGPATTGCPIRCDFEYQLARFDSKPQYLVLLTKVRLWTILIFSWQDVCQKQFQSTNQKTNSSVSVVGAEKFSRAGILVSNRLSAVHSCSARRVSSIAVIVGAAGSPTTTKSLPPIAIFSL